MLKRHAEDGVRRDILRPFSRVSVFFWRVRDDCGYDPPLPHTFRRIDLAAPTHPARRVCRVGEGTCRSHDILRFTCMDRTGHEASPFLKSTL